MNPGIIAQKAINGGQLTISERAQLPPSILAQLAIGGHLELTKAERERLPVTVLAQLAIGGHIELTSLEIKRLPVSVRSGLEIGGHISTDAVLVEELESSTNSMKHSAGEDTTTSMSGPQNKHEQAVYDAVTILVGGSEELLISIQDLRTICKASSDYTLRLIDKNRIKLMYSTGSNSQKIAEMIRTIEWELRGASRYLGLHNVVSEEESFILQRLADHPDDFNRDDFLKLLQQFQNASNPIRIATLELFGKHVTSFAERISSEPPGMSEDIVSLKYSIRDYGFDDDMNEILQKIDDNLQQKSDAFDQTATMRHIRSFYENLHESVGRELQNKRPNVGNGTPLEKCGQAIDYLERKNVITPKLQELARCLYAILSDGDYGVHALRANRDYTRLCRNMVVEYAVTLFFELERRLAEPGDT